MIGLEPHKRVLQVVFTLAQRVDPTAYRHHPLAHVEVEALDKRRVDLPGAGRKHFFDPLQGAEHHTVLARYTARSRYHPIRRRLAAEAKVAAAAEGARRAAADAERRRTGQKRRGKIPKPIEGPPDDKAQMRFTDPALQIMRLPNKGGDYCGNVKRVGTVRVRASWPVT